VYVVLTSADPGKVENLTVNRDSHVIGLNWTKPIESGNCKISYAIYWRAITHANSSNHSNTLDEFYVIGGLDACVTYEVSVTAVHEFINQSSDSEVKNVTTLADGKWQLMYMSQAYTCFSPFEAISTLVGQLLQTSRHLSISPYIHFFCPQSYPLLSPYLDLVCRLCVWIVPRFSSTHLHFQ
jgi:hypothetical protein